MNLQATSNVVRPNQAFASIQRVGALRPGTATISADITARRSFSLDGLDAHFLLDRDQRLVGRDDGAESVTSCSWSPIRMVGQRIEINDERGAALLHAYVRCVEQRARCGVDLPLGHPHLRARVMELQKCAGASSRAMYLLHVTCPRQSTNFIAMGMRLRLTPAEAGLVAALCDGESLVEHARRRGIAASTARTQMKSAMRKLGVHSQMAAVLLMLRIAHARD
jgi:DNA-binding CsgD family transcriptional regulator